MNIKFPASFFLTKKAVIEGKKKKSDGFEKSLKGECSEGL